MISFAVTVDQIRSAPPEVRRWLEAEIVGALREAASSRPEPAHSPELAACSPDEALALFDLVQNDFAAAQVLLEFGARTATAGQSAPAARLCDRRIQAKAAAFRRSPRQLLRDDQSRLHAGSRRPGGGAVRVRQQQSRYVHEATHAAIRSVWERLTANEAPAHAAPPPFGFVPPEIGPAEPIAPHQGMPV